jgi:mannose-1-phosphate guanylyltransferase
MQPWVVVLAGGVGSRFWPLSTPERPKQLLPLVDEKPMVVNTIERLIPLVDIERVLVSTNETLVEATATALPSLPRENIIAEPRAAGTAAALAWAAAEIERRSGPDTVMICVHADWAIGDPEMFRTTLLHAASVARATHGLVTVGIVPTRPDPGFGYIEPGKVVELQAAGDAFTTHHVARFVEKPSRDRASEMVQHGYLWNSGIFVWRVTDFLDQVRTHTPEVAPALQQFTSSTSQLAEFFTAVTPISVDVGVLERSKQVYVIPGSFGWDDVGTWAALHRVREHDDLGNATTGDVYAVEASNNVVYAEKSTVVLYGVSDLVVVSRNGLTVVTTVDKSADLKTLIDSLPPHLRTSA